MSRSLKKGAFVDPKLALKVQKQKDSGGHDPIKTWSRRTTVTPDFVGHRFLVHNGKLFTNVLVTEDMVGHKLGEFSPTRHFRGHPGTKDAAAGAAKEGGKT